MSKQENLERRALKLIMERGEKGILQKNLWRELDATSREGSRIALKLEAQNIVSRERELADGRWTYRLYLKRSPPNIDSLLDVPCMTCDEIQRCEAGGEISPTTCVKLTGWLISYGKPSEEG